MLTKITIALAAALMLGTGSAALARGMGGSDIGPLGQCFNPPDCGNKRAAYAAHCPLVRERIVTSSGNVVYKRHRVCS